MILTQRLSEQVLVAYPSMCGGDPGLLPTIAGGVSLIPASAGVIPKYTAFSKKSHSCPHMCGGDPNEVLARAVKQGLIPAYAGVIPRVSIRRWLMSSYPSMCGGDPTTLEYIYTDDTLSSHTRG